MGGLGLALVQVLAGIVGLAVDVKAQPAVLAAGDVRDLEGLVGGAQDHRDAAGRVDDLVEIAEAAELVGVVVQRVGAAVGGLDAQVVVQEAAGDEQIGVVRMLRDLEARLDLAVAAAVQRHLAAVFIVGLGGDIDDAGGAQAVFGGQGAGDQLDAAGQAGADGLAEHAEALGQDDAVEAELQAVVLAADVQLAVRVLRHAGRLQDHLVQLAVIAPRHGLDGLVGQGVGGGADLGLDRGAGPVEASGGDDDLGHGRGLGGRRRGGRAGRSAGRLGVSLARQQQRKRRRTRQNTLERPQHERLLLTRTAV